MITEKGQSIEEKSMEIIENEIGNHSYDKYEWPVVRRVIHATADFDFARENMMIFHKDAIQKGTDSLKNGCNIIVDVNGVAGGFNKKNLKDFGNKVICNISDPKIVNQARKLNKTRAQTSMRMSTSDMDDGMVVIGNSPTALLEVIQMIKERITAPALVIGVPVGFVSAAESKEELQKLSTPYITNSGRKGGSPCASAIINALFKLIRENSST
ncbi:MAG: precorrin-8X methylmutase [Nitrosopumilaceae archaeon]